jgi:hypothetical protein
VRLPKSQSPWLTMPTTGRPNLRNPMRFSPAIATAAADHGTFVEVPYVLYSGDRASRSRAATTTISASGLLAGPGDDG